MLLHDSQLVRLAEKGSVPTACEASCVSIFSLSSFLPAFSAPPFWCPPPPAPFLSDLSAQYISLAAHTGVGWRESSWSHLFETNPEKGWAAIQLKGRQRRTFAMKLREKMKWCILSEKKCKKGDKPWALQWPQAVRQTSGLCLTKKWQI